MLYDNGWFVGNILYFNTTLKEYKVIYDDETSDFVAENDIDDVEVIVI